MGAKSFDPSNEVWPVMMLRLRMTGDRESRHN